MSNRILNLVLAFLSLYLFDTSANILNEENSNKGNISQTTTINSSRVLDHEEALLHAIFWEVRPFIFTNEETGTLEGIIPEIFEQASIFCNARKPFIRYITRTASREEFFKLARSNLTYGEGVLSDVDRRRAFWAPVVSPTNNKNDELLERKKLRSFQILKTQHISVIVRRDLISLPNKIFRGIMACEQIFVLAILIAVIVGIILWIIERFRNEAFPQTFTKGAMTGLYWSIVSMTTVGYGDIQPVTALGRFVTCFWLFIGVMVGCVMTATVTDVVAGNDFSIQNKRVAVLENSFEQRAAEKQYRAIAVPARSYEEVLQMVRQQNVYAAMMNSDVAAWYNDQINQEEDGPLVPLSMVKKLPANLYVHCFLPIDLMEQMKSIFKCMYYQKDEVYTLAEESYRLHHHPESIFIGSTGDLMSQNAFVRAIVGILAALIGFGLIYDGWKYFSLKYNDTEENPQHQQQQQQFKHGNTRERKEKRNNRRNKPEMIKIFGNGSTKVLV